jgi:hypothetical protein
MNPQMEQLVFDLNFALKWNNLDNPQMSEI